MIKNANEFSKKIKKFFASSDYIYEPKNRKKSLKYVSRQLVLINLSDREKDYLEILDDDFEVINEIKNVKNSQMEDYTI